MTTQLRYLASIKQTRRNFTSRHGSLHATTPLCVVKKKRGSNLTSHESLFTKNSHSRVQLSASLPPSNPSNTRKRLLRYTFPFLFSSFPTLASNRWSSSTSLPQGLLIERERGWQRNIDTVKFNGLIYDRHKSSVTSPCTQVSRNSPRSTLALFSTLPFTHVLVSPFVRPFLWKRGEGGDNKWGGN